MSLARCSVRLAAVALALAASAAAAHDTWLAPASAGARTLQLELATGDRFPLAESAMPRTSIADARCLDAQGRRSALRIAEIAERATLFSSPALQRGGPLACWVETRPHEVDLTDELVDVYFREIRPQPPLVQAWAALKAERVAWRERYSKLARIEIAASPDAAVPASLRTPTGRGLEILPLADTVLRIGAPVAFRMTLDGQPVPQQSVELVSDKSRFGLWHTTDERGEFRVTLPFNGRWLLRATHLVAPTDAKAPWESRFGTFLFEAR